MIAIAGIGHRIGGRAILHEVSLELPGPGITAVIGPNGAGKSTLLNLIARLLTLQRGRIEIDGLDLARTPSKDLALKLSIVAQQLGIASRLRVGDLVAFGRWPHHRGRAGAADRAATEEAMAAFDLKDLRDRFLDELSGGERQRAFVAMAFAQSTDWLLLDEPLNNLDMSHARALMERLHAISRPEAAAPKGVVLVVHDINYAAAWADHIVGMKAGRVFLAGPPGKVLTQPLLSGLFDMEIRVRWIDGRPLILHYG